MMNNKFKSTKSLFKMQVTENHLIKVVSYLVSEEIIRQENGYLKF